MTAAARLDLRLNPGDKARITRAAELRGIPVSVFVRDAVLHEAESVMESDLSVTLSPEESRRVLAAMDKSFKPSARLKKAMERGLTVALAQGEDGDAADAPRRSVTSLAGRLRRRATARMSTDEIMRLTRGA
jgi:uncharacterized protein (DUF1778 family)